MEISPLHDLYSTKDTYISLALTNGVKHYGRFVHSSQTDAIELARIDREQPSPEAAQSEHHFEHRHLPIGKNPRVSAISVASPTGFEPVLPT